MDIPRINYRPLEDQFKEIGSQIKSSVPHVMIGKNSNTNTLPKQENNPINQIKDQNNNNDDVFSKNEKDWVKKVQKWGMIILIAFVLCYAAYSLIF
jgi:hypothetical protein